MRFSHKAVEARWDGEKSKWTVEFQKTDGQGKGEIVKDEGDVLLTGIGNLNKWEWPQLKGLHDFEGKLLHSAEWDQNFDPDVRRYR